MKRDGRIGRVVGGYHNAYYKKAELTPREKEVVNYFISTINNPTKSFRLIAEELGMKESTVKAHFSNMFNKFNIEGANRKIKLMKALRDKGLLSFE